MIDVEKITKQVLDASQSSVEFLCYRITSEVCSACESPIEALLMSSFLANMVLADVAADEWAGFSFVLRRSLDEETKGAAAVIPQFEWNGYRIDWAIHVPRLPPPHLIFVECDGHEFHERTKEQAARDRQKDRAIQEAGVPILRFTGSEIFRNPSSCGVQLLQFIVTRVTAHNSTQQVSDNP